MNQPRSILSLVLVAAPLLAQNTTVVPSIYATVEANSSATQPFGLTGACRAQHLYSSALVAVPAVTVTRIAIRGNGGSAAAAKNNVDLEIRMSTTTADPYRPSSTFANNHGVNVATVFNRKLVNLPAQTATTPPAPFVTQFPLDQNQPYDPGQGNLLIDLLVHGQVAGTYTHDTSAAQNGTVTTIGTACQGATQAVTGGNATAASSTVGFNLSGAIPNGVAFHLVGVTQFPVGLPLPLGGCLLHQDFPLLTQRPVSGAGAATITYPLRYEFKGATILGQYLAIDSGFTQMVASQSHRVLIGGLDPQSRILATGSVSATTGTVSVGTGIVTQLWY